MKNFIVYDSEGNILRTGSCQDGDVSLQAGSGEFVMEGTADDAIQMIVNDEVVSKPEPTNAEKNAAALEELRVKRDSALQWCDWTQVPDSPLSSEQRSEWQMYRQQLRDLPNDYATITSLEQVNFPTAPS
tara:strand:+ start:1507 stop:1896 length:390 start_codon:yes stop_codon:yes gene_type:complete